MQKYSFLILLLIFLITGCDNNSEELKEPMTPEQAEEEILAMGELMSDDLVNMIQSDGAEALMDLSNLTLPQMDANQTARFNSSDLTKIKESLKVRAQGFSQVFLPEQIGARTKERFVFEDHLGIYTYNFEFDSWDYTSGGIDHIQLVFPTEGSTENNAKFSLFDYEEVVITQNYGDFVDEYINPTVIDAALEIDEIMVATLDFQASWNEIGDPTSATVALMLKPFQYNITFDDLDATKSSLDVSVTHDDEFLIGSGFDITFISAEKEKLSEAIGYTGYRDFRIDATVDVEGFENATEESDLQEFYSAVLTKDGQKVGDIELDFENEVVYIVFANGEKKDLAVLLAPVFDEIELLLVDLSEETPI